MLGMSLLVAGAASPEVEPVGAANDPSRPATDLATDPKLIPANRALSDGCDLAHPRSKRCSTEGHPSGLNRSWNDPGAIERTRRTVEAVGVDLAAAPVKCANCGEPTESSDAYDCQHCGRP